MIAWNINGRIPGSVEYFARWERTLSPRRKYDNAIYIVMTTFDEILPLESDVAILEHLAILKQPLKFIQNRLRKDMIEQGLDSHLPKNWDECDYTDWRTTLIYISDRWLDITRIQWMLDLITLLEGKIIIGERSQVLYGINDIKEMEGLI